jgi:hypothetical protein
MVTKLNLKQADPLAKWKNKCDTNKYKMAQFLIYNRYRSHIIHEVSTK